MHGVSCPLTGLLMDTIKKIYLLLMLFISPLFAFADSNLNQVQMQLSAEDWVNTQSAEVTVAIDGVLDKTGAFAMRDQINVNLKTLANVDWHLTVFEITKNPAGLDQIHVEALARVPENLILGLRDKAKSISKPGVDYKINRTDFTPSLAEFESTRGNLRGKLYEAVKDEIIRINKFYPEDKYILQSINFQETPIVQPMLSANKMQVAAGSPLRTATADSSVLAVSSKIQLTALVVLTIAPQPSPEEKKIAKLEASITNNQWHN